MFEKLKQKIFGSEYDPESNLLRHFFTKKTIAGILVFLFLLVSIPIGTYVVEQRTNLSSKANINPSVSVLGAVKNGEIYEVTSPTFSLALNPGGNFSEATSKSSTYCDLTAACDSNKTCTFDLSKFYIDGQLQPKGSYRATLTPDLSNPSTTTGWVCTGNSSLDSTDGCTKNELSGYSAQHTYGSGSYTAKMEVTTSKSPGYTSCTAVVRTGTSAPKCVRDNAALQQGEYPDEDPPDKDGCWCKEINGTEVCKNNYPEIFTALQEAEGGSQCQGKLAGNVGVINVTQEIPGKIVDVNKGQVWGGGQGIHPAGSPKDPDYKYIGAKIEVFNSSGSKEGGATTGNTGKYTVTNLSSGPHTAKLDLSSIPGYRLTSDSRGTHQKSFDIDSCDDQDNAGWTIEPI